MFLRPLMIAAAFCLGLVAPVAAADRDKLVAFLEVTGYDVVIEAIRHGALAGPGLVGDAPAAFGQQYTRLVEEVFVVDDMRERALELLASVLSDRALNAGAEFYASELGQRLVRAENASHLTDDQVKYGEGQDLVQRYAAEQSPRLIIFRDIVRSIDSENVGEKAMVQIQVRFIMAAIASGVSKLQLSEQELRQRLTREAQDNAGRNELMTIIANAYTYRNFSDADLSLYLEALQTPEMRELYEVLNAVQFRVMVEWYEKLGLRLGELAPQRDL